MRDVTVHAGSGWSNIFILSFASMYVSGEKLPDWKHPIIMHGFSCFSIWSASVSVFVFIPVSSIR